MKAEEIDGIITECHLVEETDTHTIGHGEDREDIYYIKEVLPRINCKSCYDQSRVVK